MRYENMTLDRTRAARVFAAATSIVISTMKMGVAAEARGSHDHRFGEHGMNFGGSFAGGRSHAEDAYVRAASEEQDKLLNTKLKSICRGC